MEETIIDFGEKNTTEKEFYSNDNTKIFNIDNININEILISKGLFLGSNDNNYYVIGYKQSKD